MFRHIAKGWGHYIDIYRSKHLCLKILNFNPKSRLSTQRHFYRNELWWLIGTAKFTWIPKGTWHRFETDEACQIFEIQFGSDVREDDIERI